MPTSSMLNLDVPDVVLLNIHVKSNGSSGSNSGGVSAVNSSLEFGRDIESDGQSSADSLPITVCFRIVDERTVDEHQLPAAPKSGPTPLPGVPEDDNEDDNEDDDEEDDDGDGGGGDDDDDSSPADGGEGKSSEGTSVTSNGRADGTDPGAGEQRDTAKRPSVSAGDALAAYLRGDITLKALQKIQDELGLGNEKEEPNGKDDTFSNAAASSSAAGAPPSAATRRTLRKMLDEMDAGDDDDDQSDDVVRSRSAHYYVKLLRGLESNHPRAPRESSALGAHRGEAFDTQNPVKYFYEDPETGACPLTQCWSYLKRRARLEAQANAIHRETGGGAQPQPSSSSRWGISLYTTTAVFPNVVTTGKEKRGRQKAQVADPLHHDGGGGDDDDDESGSTRVLRFLPNKIDKNGWSNRFDLNDVRFEVVRAITYVQYTLNVKCNMAIKSQIWTMSNQVYTAGISVWPDYDVEKPRGGMAKTLRSGRSISGNSNSIISSSSSNNIMRVSSVELNTLDDDDVEDEPDDWNAEKGVVGLRDIKRLSAEWEEFYHNDHAAKSLNHRMVQRWYHLQLHFNPTHHLVEFTGTSRIGFKFEHFLTAMKDGAIFKNEHATKLYFTLIISAGFMAGLGLAHNSVVVIVASMLVSPLMGPIMHSCVGIGLLRSYDKAPGPIAAKERRAATDLIWRGIVAELAGIFLCVLCGVITAFIYLAIDRGVAQERSVTSDWPNPEMEGRGDLWGLLVGFFVALVSAIGVTAATFDASGGIATLIGVGISASLLPPAVNCGMLWVLALWTQFSDDNVRGFVPLYGLELGGLSLALTLVNVTTIFAVVFIVYFTSVSHKADKKGKVHTLTHSELGDGKTMTVGKLYAVHAPMAQDMFDTYHEPTQGGNKDTVNIADKQATLDLFRSPSKTPEEPPLGSRMLPLEIERSGAVLETKASGILRERSMDSVNGGATEGLAGIAKMAAQIVEADKQSASETTMELVDVVYELVQIGLGPEYGRLTSYDATKMYSSLAELDDY